MNQDEEHLRLLSIFHYIVGGLGCLCATFPIFHLGLGIAVLSGAIPGPPNSPEFPRAFGGMIVFLAGGVMLAGWSVAIATIFAGKFLAQRRRYTYCLVIAAIICLSVPVGTVLGVFTIIVLVRPTVKELFAQNDGPRV